MSLRPEYLIEFPFHSDSMKLLNLPDFDEDGEQDVEDYFVDNIRLLFEVSPTVLEELKSFYEDVFNKTEQLTSSYNERGQATDKTRIALYKLSIVFPYCFRSQMLINAMANLWAKEIFDRFSKLDRKVREELLICADLGINVEKISPKDSSNIRKISPSLSGYLEYRINYPDYLKHSVNINDPYYKLTNKFMLDGQVYLIKNELAHLVREAVRARILDSHLDMSDELIEKLKSISEFNEMYTEIETKLAALKKSLADDAGYIGQVSSDLFPPCINVILSKALEGINLAHYERLSIAFFFLNTNHSVEETIDVFRTLPDFNESICRYQVEHANGQGSSGKKYSMFGCDKMKSFSLCFANDKNFGETICSQGIKKKGSQNYEYIKNPLEFIFWKKVELNRKNRRNNNSAGATDNVQSGGS